ncbi:MAG: hypothetical protein NT027_15460 [Proteobacteria bacterium]|nr:hypothetical protein [Pseudomonadota bacterium]
MKKIAENRYPNAATLFRFCKEALEIRYEGNVKVIDQDVGAILGYDPADCSHWKKGKKNIRSLSTLRTIADHLAIDERLLIDIAAGKVGFDEAIFEFRGYGAFSLQGRTTENLKKEFFKDPTRYRSEESKLTFEDLFDVDRAGVAAVVQNIIQAGQFEEAPLYVPELVQSFTNFKVIADETMTESFKVISTGEAENLVIQVMYKGSEMRPYLRYLVARELFKFLVNSHHAFSAKLRVCPPEVMDIRANLFAGLLLVPGQMLRKEVEKVDTAKDIVTQLSDTFWVSKAMMNQRLRDYMENMN